MIGCELTVDGAAVVKGCMEKGLLINCTHGTVLRLLPAMNLTDAELRGGLRDPGGRAGQPGGESRLRSR